MPKINQRKDEYAADDFIKAMWRAGSDLELRSAQEIAEYCGMDARKLRDRLKNPMTFKLAELKKLYDKLRMQPEAWLLLVGGAGK